MKAVIEVTPDILARFAAYLAILGNGSWGSLHIVLEDMNLDDNSVKFCIDHAEERGDNEGRALGLMLLAMSRTQRGKIAKKVRA